jgi:hypothetical protein
MLDTLKAPNAPRQYQLRRWLQKVAGLAAAGLALRAARSTNRLASPVEVIERAKELAGWETAARDEFATLAEPLGAELAALRAAALRFAQAWGREDAVGQWATLMELVACCDCLPWGRMRPGG